MSGLNKYTLALGLLIGGSMGCTSTYSDLSPEEKKAFLNDVRAEIKKEFETYDNDPKKIAAQEQEAQWRKETHEQITQIKAVRAGGSLDELVETKHISAFSFIRKGIEARRAAEASKVALDQRMIETEEFRTEAEGWVKKLNQRLHEYNESAAPKTELQAKAKELQESIDVLSGQLTNYSSKQDEAQIMTKINDLYSQIDDLPVGGSDSPRRPRNVLEKVVSDYRVDREKSGEELFEEIQSGKLTYAGVLKKLERAPKSVARDLAGFLYAKELGSVVEERDALLNPDKGFAENRRIMIVYSKQGEDLGEKKYGSVIDAAYRREILLQVMTPKE